VGPPVCSSTRRRTSLFVADGYFNHRVVVFDAETGQVSSGMGAYGKKPDDSYKFPPRRNSSRDPPPQFNNPVHAGARCRTTTLVYRRQTARTTACRFKVDGDVREGGVRRKEHASSRKARCTNFVFSPDKEQRFLYVMDGSNKAIRVYDRKSMELLTSIGGHAGHNAREFFHRTASRSTRRGTCSSAR